MEQKKCCSCKKMVFLSTMLLAALYAVTFGMIVMHNEASKEFSVAESKLVDHKSGQVVSSKCHEALCEDPFSDDLTSAVNWITFWSKDSMTKTQVVGMHKLVCDDPADETCVDGFHHVYNTNHGYYLAIPGGRQAIFKSLDALTAQEMIFPTRGLLATPVIRTVASGVVMA